MDQKPDKNQNIGGTDQISATPGGKEGTPSEIGGEQNPLDEFATHKEPEVSQELNEFVKPVSTPAAQRIIDEVLPESSVEKQNSNVQLTSDKQAISAEGNIGLGITWLDALMKKIERLKSFFGSSFGSRPKQPV